MLPNCQQLWDKMMSEAHWSNDTLDALNSLMVHWSYQDAAFSRQVATIIIDGVDKSGADQVLAYLDMMHAFVGIEDSLTQLRLKELHEPEGFWRGRSGRGRTREKQGVLTMICTYRMQHKPFTFASMQKLTRLMQDNALHTCTRVKRGAARRLRSTKGSMSRCSQSTTSSVSRDSPPCCFMALSVGSRETW